jgi:hypothetical protein
MTSRTHQQRTSLVRRAAACAAVVLAAGLLLAGAPAHATPHARAAVPSTPTTSVLLRAGTAGASLSAVQVDAVHASASQCRVVVSASHLVAMMERGKFRAGCLYSVSLNSVSLNSVSASPHGWFGPVVCYCMMADELTFQHALAAFLEVAAAALHHRSLEQPLTGMRLKTKGGWIRYPDIYYFKLDASHPSKGFGFLNELKVGDQAMGRAGTEASRDVALLKQRHGYGTSAKAHLKGRYLPVDGVIWWFAPDVYAYTYDDFKWIVDNLLLKGINVVWMQQDDNAMPWPRRESKKQKEDDVKEIESNNETAATTALDNMMQPCPEVCPAP